MLSPLVLVKNTCGSYATLVITFCNYWTWEINVLLISNCQKYIFWNLPNTPPNKFLGSRKTCAKSLKILDSSHHCILRDFSKKVWKYKYFLTNSLAEQICSFLQQKTRYWVKWRKNWVVVLVLRQLDYFLSFSFGLTRNVNKGDRSKFKSSSTLKA